MLGPVQNASNNVNAVSSRRSLVHTRVSWTMPTLPKGFSLRNSGVLFVLPISIGGISIFAPTYRAAINVLNAFLLPGGDHNLYVAMFALTIRRRSRAVTERLAPDIIQATLVILCHVMLNPKGSIFGSAPPLELQAQLLGLSRWNRHISYMLAS